MDATDDRLTRLVALLADRDRQLADRLALGELEGRVDRSAAVVEDLIARLAAAESDAALATARADAEQARADAAEAELTALRATVDPPATAARAASRAALARAVGTVRGRRR